MESADTAGKARVVGTYLPKPAVRKGRIALPRLSREFHFMRVLLDLESMCMRGSETEGLGQTPPIN